MSQFSATVGSTIKSVMPAGTNLPGTVSVDKKKTKAAQKQNIGEWADAPVFAPDLFAVTAYLCKVGGVVTYFNPSPYGINDQTREFHIDEKKRKIATKTAENWRKDRDGQIEFPKICTKLWQELIAAWDQPINPGHYDHIKKQAPAWWSAAFQLAMIADMACLRLFRNKIPLPGQSMEDFDNATEEPFELALKSGYLQAKEDALEKEIDFRSPASLCLMADDSVVCVLPKIRISPVGATIRNVSRNLALLPGKGEVRCLWSNLASKATPNEDHEALDILLIPEPRELQASDFVPEHNGTIDLREVRRNKWAWDNFDLHQNWIDHPDKTERNKKRMQFIKDCVNLLEAAKRESKNVNAIVLPEFAVDYRLFEILCWCLKRTEPRLEFVISGSSSNCDGDKGNIVLTRVWDNIKAPREYVTDSRRKHHRWRMNRSQVETYALSSALNPKIENWWEKTPLGRRELYFHRFRKASVFSVLICEELARSDPCHEILRAVGPNLIFALLLDGPQIRNRWPAQYASNLADDPGSSVLTFTSYGLIDRSNKQGTFPPNRSFAMWKDDSGKIVEIDMPTGDGPRGVLLSLWPEHVRDITITGKRSEERAWRYASHFPIVL